MINAVDDLGCDPSGETACDEQLEDGVTDRSVIQFPAGTYRFERGHHFSDLNRLGFEGTGDVTFVPPEGFNDKLIWIDGTEVVFTGIDVDVSAPETTAGLRFITQDRFRVEDVEIRGRGDHPDSDVVNGLSLAVMNRSGTGVVRNFVARKGSIITNYKGGNGRVGVWIGHRHRGTITIENCQLEEFGNNGIYASRNRGRIRVSDCRFRNNNVSGVRLGGGGNTISDVTIDIDLDTYSGPTTDGNGQYNPRGIIIEQGSYDNAGRVIIEDCDIRVRKAPRSQGGIVVWPTGNGPEIKRTSIETNVEWAPGIRGQPPVSRVEPEEQALTIQDVTITGSANRGSAIEIRERPGSSIEQSTIEQSGTDRDGIQLIAANPCTLLSTQIRSSRYPLFAITPRDGETCLCYVVGETTLTRTDSNPASIQSTAIEDQFDSLFPVLIPGGLKMQCVGSEILAQLDTPKGIAITTILEDTVYWIHQTSIDTAINR